MTAPEENTGLTHQVVAPGVTAHVGERGMPNAVTVEGRDGVVVVDSLFTLRHARLMMAALRATTDKPVLALVNTHFHGDHVLGNAEIPTDRIIAHRYVTDRLSSDGDAYRALLCDVRPDLAPEIASVDWVLPTEFVADRLDLDLGDVTVRVQTMNRPAHTAGDLIVSVRDPDVLIASDLVFNGVLPVARDADLSGWVAVLDELERDWPTGVVVPGHGAPGGPELLAQQREILLTVANTVVAVRAGGGTRAEARAAALEQIQDLMHADERLEPYVAQVWGKEMSPQW